MAVSVLLDGCNKLARQELQAVGALAELREEMGRRQATLQDSWWQSWRRASIGWSLQRRLAGAARPTAARWWQAAAAVRAAAGAASPAVPRLLLSSPSMQRHSSSQEAEHSGVAGNLSARGLPPRPPPALARTASWGRDGGNLASAPSAGGRRAGQPGQHAAAAHAPARTDAGRADAGRGGGSRQWMVTWWTQSSH